MHSLDETKNYFEIAYKKGTLFYLDEVHGYLEEVHGLITANKKVDKKDPVIHIEEIGKDAFKLVQPIVISITHTPSYIRFSRSFIGEEEYQSAITAIIEFMWATYKQHKDNSTPRIEFCLDNFILKINDQPATFKYYNDVLNNLYK